MTQDEIRAIALEVAKHTYADEVLSNSEIQDLCTRFLAAIAEKVEPVAWYCKGRDKFGEFYSYVVGGEKPVSEVYSEIIPLYTHPTIEPKSAPLPDEVRELVEELRCNHGKFGDTVADLIERLARQRDELLAENVRLKRQYHQATGREPYVPDIDIDDGC